MPDTSYKKNEERTVKVGRQESKVIYKEDGWIASIATKYDKQHDPIEPIESVIERFIDMLRPAAAYIKDLSSKAEITLWVDVYPQTEQQNVHLSANVIKSLYETGISLDCCMSFLVPLYDQYAAQTEQ